MEEIVRILPPTQWVSINRTCAFFQVYLLSQIITSDGTSVNISQLSPTDQIVSTMTFPTEQPTSTDFKLWQETIQLITSPKAWLFPPLGKYLQIPYSKTYWLTDADRTILLKMSQTSTLELYWPCDGVYRTQGWHTYQLTDTLFPLPEGTHIETEKDLSSSQVTVQSQAPMLSNECTSLITLMASLAVLGTSTL